MNSAPEADSGPSLTVLAQARDKNSKVPIGRLPVEVMQLIWLFCVSWDEETRQNDSNPFLPWLTHVCSRWREWAIRYSELWTTFIVDRGRYYHDMPQIPCGTSLCFNLDDPSDKFCAAIKTIVSRCTTSKRRVYIIDDTASFHPLGHSKLFSILFSNQHRIERVEYVFTTQIHWESMKTPLEFAQTVPHLEALYWSFNNTHYAPHLSPPADFDPIVLPELKTFVIDNAPETWYRQQAKLINISLVQHLCLHGRTAYETTAWNPQYVADMLYNALSLKTLSLEWRHIGRAEDRMGSMFIACIQRLHRLVICDFLIELISPNLHAFLEALDRSRLPNLRYILLRERCEGTEQPNRYNVMLSHLLERHRHLTMVTYLEWTDWREVTFTHARFYQVRREKHPANHDPGNLITELYAAHQAGSQDVETWFNKHCGSHKPYHQPVPHRHFW